MKLLLTSAGLCNGSLRKTLKHIVDSKNIRIAFIPTAANVEDGEKDWLIKDYLNCSKVGSVDIVDISAISKDMWLPRLESANVILCGGGNPFHLMHWINASGLRKILPELLKTRLYVGISAGSMVMCPNLSLSSSNLIYGDKLGRDMPGLNYVDFYIKPHYNSISFSKARDEFLKPLAQGLGELYALDDESGIKVIEGSVEIISEGKWKKF